MRPDLIALECVLCGLVAAVVLCMGWFVLRLTIGLGMFVGLVWRLLGRLARKGAD